MFIKILIKLTGIFLFCQCISVTSATPPRQPGEVQNIDINDDIHARTTSPYLCQDPFVWVRRECLGEISARAWQDVCVWHSFVTLNDFRPGICPEGTTCLDGLNDAGIPTINCFPAYQRSGKRKYDPQSGVSDTKKGRTQLGNTQQQYSVTLDHDMTGATVSAVFESECRTVDVHCRMFLKYSCRESIKFRWWR